MIFKGLSVAKNCIRPESAPLNNRLKLMGGVTKLITKKLLDHGIFSSLIRWDTKHFLKNF